MVENEQFLGMAAKGRAPQELVLGDEARREEYYRRHGIEVEVLPSGTVVVGACRPSSDTQETELDVVLQVGAGNDPAGKEGLIHWTEHLLFKGCPGTDSQREQVRQFYFLGYRINAHTSPLQLVVESGGSSGLVNKNYGFEPRVRNLAGMVLRATLAPDAFESERKLILDEHQRNLRNYYRQGLRFVSQTLFPQGHPLTRLGTGDEQSLSRIDHTDVVAAYNEHFVPQNAYVHMMTHGDADKHRMAKDLFGRVWGETAEGKKGRRQVWDITGLEKIVEIDKGAEYTRRMDMLPGRAWISVVTPLKTDMLTPEGAALDMALGLLRGEVFSELRSLGGYGPSLDQVMVPFSGVGYVSMGMEVDKKLATELRSGYRGMISNMIAKAIADGLPEKEVTKEAMWQSDSPVGLKNRLMWVSWGLRRFGVPVDLDALRRQRREVKERDVRMWLEKWVDDPGALFVLGDI